jgi:hypothetical protein
MIEKGVSLANNWVRSWETILPQASRERINISSTDDAWLGIHKAGDLVELDDSREHTILTARSALIRKNDIARRLERRFSLSCAEALSTRGQGYSSLVQTAATGSFPIPRMAYALGDPTGIFDSILWQKQISTLNRKTLQCDDDLFALSCRTRGGFGPDILGDGLPISTH